MLATTEDEENGDGLLSLLLNTSQKVELSFLRTDLAGSAAVIPAFAAATDAYDP